MSLSYDLLSPRTHTPLHDHAALLPRLIGFPGAGEGSRALRFGAHRHAAREAAAA